MIAQDVLVTYDPRTFSIWPTASMRGLPRDLHYCGAWARSAVVVALPAWHAIYDLALRERMYHTRPAERGHLILERMVWLDLAELRVETRVHMPTLTHIELAGHVASWREAYEALRTLEATDLGELLRG